MERITSQRETILDYLKGVDNHPSAETIYDEVRKKLPRISRGTVYRNLKNLKRKGEIQEISAGIAYFDGDISSHAHFICQKCNKIFDIFDICKECGVLKRKKTKVGKINNYQISFYGYCQKCNNRKS
ncbi:MAG: Ferric uptake regulator, Fur family [Parcubacteria group bacterium GW2011_GWF2_43_11]|nr:MAG: Ferric uptake regulator, Fur family [Parcubacteria group bacterium GW2011_GWF2_43_11]